MQKNNNICPYDILGSLACDMIYRDQELYRQMDVQLKSGAKINMFFSADLCACACNPELCSRYTEHLMRNLRNCKNHSNGR